jgi:hypothetical protein
MDRDTVLDLARRQAAIDRAAYFATPGATASGWRGGRSTVETDRRKEASRRACRGSADG